MADSTLSSLTAASTLDGTELYYTVQSGNDRKATGAQIKTLVLASSTGTGSVVVFNTAARLVAPTIVDSVGVGSVGGTSGTIVLFGSSTGSCRVYVSSTAGNVALRMPTTNGGTNSVMASDGSGNLSFIAASGGGDLLAANNLNDVASTVTALSNLGGAPLAGNKNLTGGFTTTEYNAGSVTAGTFTPNAFNGAIQRYVNAGAHSLAPPASVSALILECINSVGGNINSAAYTIVSGDAFSSTGTKRHLFYITKTASTSQLHVQYVTGT